MSFMLVAPDILQTAAADITQIGSAVSAGNLAAAIPTTAVTAAAPPMRYRRPLRRCWRGTPRSIRRRRRKAATYQEQFVHGLSAAATSYVGTEATNRLGAAGGAGTGECGRCQRVPKQSSMGPIHTAGQAWISSPAR